MKMKIKEFCTGMWNVFTREIATVHSMLYWNIWILQDGIPQKR